MIIEKLGTILALVHPLADKDIQEFVPGAWLGKVPDKPALHGRRRLRLGRASISPFFDLEMSHPEDISYSNPSVQEKRASHSRATR
jgi:hypothetical protein